jgi:signal peptidase
VGGEEQLSVADVPSPRPRAALAPVVWTAARLAAYAALGFAMVIAFVLIVPTFVGYGSLTVLSGSMEPTLHVGDVVLEHHISPVSARVGDVVTFRDPEAPARLYTHRVVSMSVSGKEVSFVTRGDANTGVERWRIPVGGRIGRVEYRIPLVGYLTNRAGSRLGRLALIVVPAILLAVFEVRRVWHRKDD